MSWRALSRVTSYRSQVVVQALNALVDLNFNLPSSFPRSAAAFSSSSIFRQMKIYTKTGDKGSSSLYSGERREKDDLVFAALGDVDELNSVIGVAREYASTLDATLGTQLEIIQSRLLDIGSSVATPIPSSKESKLQRVAFDPTATSHLEEWIDAWTSELPALTQFILPSGGPAASFLHMARSVCRRAERSVIPLARTGSTDEAVAVYLNRLSDYLFTVARVAAKKAGKPETVYKKA